MARPRLATVNESPAPILNDLELTESEKRALLVNGLNEIENLVEEKDRVVALIRTSRKRLVAQGFKPKVIDFALRLRKDEDGEIIEQRRAEMEVARFLNHPIGTQPELPLIIEDRTPIVDRAFAEGAVAGSEGKTCSAPYSTGAETEQAWIRGWHEGQATLMSAFRKLEAKDSAESEEDADGDED